MSNLLDCLVPSESILKEKAISIHPTKEHLDRAASGKTGFLDFVMHT